MRSALAMLLVLAATAPARAEEDKQLAKEVYDSGVRRYDTGDYALALDDFKRAYMIYEAPAFLYNIAQCHKQLGHYKEAAKLYKNYLAKVPDIADRAEIERLIAELEAKPDEPPPVTPTAPATTATATSKPATAPPAPAASAPTDGKRKVAIGIGVGAALVVVAVVVAALAVAFGGGRDYAAHGRAGCVAPSCMVIDWAR